MSERVAEEWVEWGVRRTWGPQSGSVVNCEARLLLLAYTPA